jgi:hypothetical protein
MCLLRAAAAAYTSARQIDSMCCHVFLDEAVSLWTLYVPQFSALWLRLQILLLVLFVAVRWLVRGPPGSTPCL